MTIEIIRSHHNPWAVDGELYIAGQKVCDTSENLKNHLTAGTYPIRIAHCHQYRRKMPVILVKGLGMRNEGTPHCQHCIKKQISSQHACLPCYCPQIKMGNGVANRLDGSIIIGQRRLAGVMLETSDNFDRLIDRLDKAANRGEAITLTIKSNKKQQII